MLTKLLKAKLHHATVTMTDLNYHGSITIDRDLLDASGMLINESVMIADCDNGNRFETYIIPGERGTGIIGINGAAARLTAVGHKIIVMTWVQATPEEIQQHASRVVIVGPKNKVAEVVMHKTIES